MDKMTRTELKRDLEQTFKKKYICLSNIESYAGIGKKRARKIMEGYEPWLGGRGGAIRYHINEVADAIYQDM